MNHAIMTGLSGPLFAKGQQSTRIATLAKDVPILPDFHEAFMTAL